MCPSPLVPKWLYLVLSWFVHRAGNAVAERELQRDLVAVLCPTSLRVGQNLLPALGCCAPALSALHTLWCHFSKLCQIRTSVLRAGGVPSSTSGSEWSNLVKVSPGTRGAVVDVWVALSIPGLLL